MAPLAVIAAILSANLLAGATQPMATLFFSGCLLFCAIVSVLLAGPRHTSLSMWLLPTAIMLWTIVGFFGPLRAAAPDASVLLGMSAVWTIGYLAASHRSSQSFLWTSLVWSLLLFTMWVFFTEIGVTIGAASSMPLSAGLGSATEAAVMFGFFSLVGSARVLHVLKQMDAEALSRSEMVDRLLRDGLGGMLLVGFALTCLVMTGSRVGLLLAGASLVFHAWWDLGYILRRDHRSTWVRILERLTPLATLAAIGGALYLACFRDESVAPGTPGAAANTHIQRLESYWNAILDQPIFGHGLAGIEPLRDRMIDLHSYVSLSAPGDARNVILNWLAEAGFVGLAMALLLLAAAHVLIVRVFQHRGAPRSLPRLAVMSSFFLALHGIADSSLGLPSLLWTYALLLGCACGVAAMQQQKSRLT